MTNDGTGGTYTYDLANNMITTNKVNSGTYKYNSLHQRVEKSVTVGSTTTKTYYIYDLNGLLLGEYDASGNPIIEHIYLNNIPVAVVKSGVIYYVHTDYLNTPRVISKASDSTTVWKWDNVNAYGFNPANETVSGTSFEYNPRFSGQYFDKETGLHYNINRMYNPELTRYMQPDPIGVNGGMNIYSYTENNPLNWTDPEGEMPSLPNGLVDYAAGLGDSASMGITSWVRRIFNIGSVNKCSGFYVAGEATDIGMNVVSLGGSIYLKSLVKGWTKIEKDASRIAGQNLPSYQNLKSVGYEVHHNNPLYGHLPIKGRSTKELSLFPTGGLSPRIHSSSLNLQAVTPTTHKILHQRLVLEENFWKINHSPIITGLKTEQSILNQCGCN